ncbi:(S)-2-hydroxy-acid oxidase, putative [Talaromyces stipitatus ATCC 10500]|uniref:(S)-2-hydroxy-acid oxidase, putative n=1 Tax=Talaromyces stipitatus (strain ATCC 10500 / CBS 375.48 / QM 6759 / NRRL 1006) TaxID=441959 RepID=B8MF27_TALSN|nr:(S)-2-hydroxy-acid oxidase, putative [Talaromyces stipitatus ATCC 10500]EED16126.1 (S)-2-hydroxy-acid oxidase, putative [Talaromyces stipitatus ATCC 10500]
MEKEYNLGELGQHSKENDAWIAVNGEIWDMAGFGGIHPGGADVIYEYFGRDASEVYNEYHSPGLISKHLGPGKRIGRLQQTLQQNDTAPSISAIGSALAISKPPLTSMLNLYDFEEVAKSTFSDKSWAYISGASNDSWTMAANHDWYKRIMLRPRVLRDVSACRLETIIFGTKFGMPIFNAPASLVRMAHPEGELAIARGASALGSTMIIPMMSSYSTDEIVEEMPPDHPFLFQVYVHPDRKFTANLLQDVCSRLKPIAIIVTVDLPAFPKREANERLAIKKAMEAEKAAMGGKESAPPGSSTASKGQNQARSAGQNIASNLVWDDIEWIKKLTKLPVVLKGIQSAADAEKAYRLGCDGIYISNHGGRALDTSMPSILVLMEIQMTCPEILDKMEVFIDGGIRRGTDVLKAICLGAKGVCLGRPMFYAANYGSAGVEHALKLVADELQVAMQLVGINSLDEANPSFLNSLELQRYVSCGTNGRSALGAARSHL